MPTPNQRIMDSAHAALRGDISLPAKSGMCLALVRVVLEHALWGGRWHWYDNYLTHSVSDKPAGIMEPWARDMEASLKEQGMARGAHRIGPEGDPGRYVDLALTKPIPGDLLFRWDTAKHESGAYIGHVGIAVHGGLVLENIRPTYRDKRAGLWRGPTRITPLGAWPITTLIRFRPEDHGST